MRGLGVLTPYSPNYLIFGLNLLVIIYGILSTVFAIRYWLSKDRAAMIAPFRRPNFWKILILASGIPFVFYVVFLFLLDLDANAFAYIALILLFAGSVYAVLQFVMQLQLRETE